MWILLGSCTSNLWGVWNWSAARPSPRSFCSDVWWCRCRTAPQEGEWRRIMNQVIRSSCVFAVHSRDVKKKEFLVTKDWAKALKEGRVPQSPLQNQLGYILFFISCFSLAVAQNCEPVFSYSGCFNANTAEQNLYVGAQYLKWVLNLWTNEVNPKISLLQLVRLKFGVPLNIGTILSFLPRWRRKGLGMVFLSLPRKGPLAPSGSIPPTKRSYCIYRCCAEFEKPSCRFILLLPITYVYTVQCRDMCMHVPYQTHTHMYIWLYMQTIIIIIYHYDISVYIYV